MSFRFFRIISGYPRDTALQQLGRIGTAVQVRLDLDHVVGPEIRTVYSVILTDEAAANLFRSSLQQLGAEFTESDKTEDMVNSPEMTWLRAEVARRQKALEQD